VPNNKLIIAVPGKSLPKNRENKTPVKELTTTCSKIPIAIVPT
jgi:hypothetical protein